MKKLFIVCVMVMLSSKALAEYNRVPDKYVEALIRVESRNNPRAIGDHGRALGVLQIHLGVIQDVNRWYGTRYKHRDAFDPSKARRICKMYTYYLIKHRKKEVTLWNVALCWNRNAVLRGRYAHRVRSALAYC